MENKTYTYKDKSYNWIKLNFEYRVWSKKFIHKFNLFERKFTEESKTAFLTSTFGEKIQEKDLSIEELKNKFTENLTPELFRLIQDYESDLLTARELFLYEDNNLKSLLTNTLEGFEFPEEFDDELETLALEVLTDFFMKTGKLKISLIK
jgi:hypothetical protein